MEAVHLLRRLAGQQLLACASAWHVYEGERAPDPTDTWLRFPDGTVNLRGASNGQGISAQFDEVGQPHDMAEYGCIVIEAGTPLLIAEHVGETLREVTALGYAPWGPLVIGLVLHMDGGDIAFINYADETWIVRWLPGSPEYPDVVALSG